MSAIAGRVLLIPKGAYNALTTYNPLDFVTYGANSYVCKQTSTGNAPTNTTYWQLMAQGATNANNISYDNTASGLGSTDVQGAIDEVVSDTNDAIDAISDVISKNGAMNLNSYPYFETTKVVNGITFTDNGDGTVTVSGTASATANFSCHKRDEDFNSLNLSPNVPIIMSGCPNGGSISTFYIELVGTVNGTYRVYGRDTGNGLSATPLNENHVSVVIYVEAGTVINTPITFKPMITLASQPDSDYAHYVPYAMTNRELTEKINCSFGLKVTLTNNTAYITPTDGYFNIISPTAVTVDAFTNGFVEYVDGAIAASFAAISNGQYGSIPNSLYVKKGTRIKYQTLTDGTGFFLPLSIN